MERKRKLYLSDANVPIPKTTAWRLGKKMMYLDSELPTYPKRRKTYHCNAKYPVPRSTLWEWENDPRSKCDDQQGESDGGDSDENGEYSDYGDGNGDGDENGGYGDDVGGDGDVSDSDDNGDGGDSDDNGDGGDSDDNGDGGDSDDNGDGGDSDDNGDGGDRDENGDGGDSDENGDWDDSDGNGDEGDSDENGDWDDSVENSDGDDSDENGGYGDDEREGNGNLQQPLFDNAPISVEESIYTTYFYAVKNKLSYEATAQLLELLRIHFPLPNLYPRSSYLLKKHLATMKKPNITHFCSACLSKIPQDQKHCHNISCVDAVISHYALLPFENQLAEIYAGNYSLIILCIY